MAIFYKIAIFNNTTYGFVYLAVPDLCLTAQIFYIIIEIVK